MTIILPVWRFSLSGSPVGGPGAPKFFWAGGPLLKFQTWCTPGDGEGQGNFFTKFCQNVRAKTGGGLVRKNCYTQQISAYGTIYRGGRYNVHGG